ncbi:MAG: C-GCAxxG-C-C family protein [Bacteroidota bacterium]|nr:C-GCAxxG-C-C family protein [Bacteroidota bacterium]
METTVNNSLQSVRLFNNGLHCSQAVQVGNGIKTVDKVLLTKIRNDIEQRYGQGNLCGAMLGGLIVLHNKVNGAGNGNVNRIFTQRLQKSFVDSFATKCDSVFCQHLLGRHCEESKLSEIENQIGCKVKQCSVYVHRACKMVNEILEEDKTLYD